MTPRKLTMIAAMAAAASVQSVRSTADYRRTMREVRAAHTVCEHAAQGCPWTNGVRLVPHHRVPVWRAPWLAASASNLVVLCDPVTARTTGCHWVCGHAGKNWSVQGDPDICRNIILPSSTSVPACGGTSGPACGGTS